MQFSTPVDISPSPWQIGPCERMLFVGSCFADNMGRRFAEEKFRTMVNPFGVMYNPASVYHTVRRLMDEGTMPFTPNEPGTAVITLGTNHIYILKATGEIVDNCQKRPQQLFREKALTVEECHRYLSEAVGLIASAFPQVRFILTVSPIRYRKYGFHGSQLSKATLLLAIDQLMQTVAHGQPPLSYFPSYEILNDELRDYRYYQPDMLHPSAQAVDYIYERMAQTYFSDSTIQFLREWAPIKAALAHRPFDASSPQHQTFVAETKRRAEALRERWPGLRL